MPRPFISRVRENCPIQDLLLDACVPDKNGRKSVLVLARQEGVSKESAHKWCRTGTIPYRRAKSILAKYNAYRDGLIEVVDLVGGDESEVPRVIEFEEFDPFIS